MVEALGVREAVPQTVGLLEGHTLPLLLRVGEEEVERERVPVTLELRQLELVADLEVVGLTRGLRLPLLLPDRLPDWLPLMDREEVRHREAEGLLEVAGLLLAHTLALLLRVRVTVAVEESVGLCVEEREGLEEALLLTVPLRLRVPELVTEGEAEALSARDSVALADTLAETEPEGEPEAEPEGEPEPEPLGLCVLP